MRILIYKILFALSLRHYCCMSIELSLYGYRMCTHLLLYHYCNQRLPTTIWLWNYFSGRAAVPRCHARLPRAVAPPASMVHGKRICVSEVAQHIFRCVALLSSILSNFVHYWETNGFVQINRYCKDDSIRLQDFVDRAFVRLEYWWHWIGTVFKAGNAHVM